MSEKMGEVDPLLELELLSIWLSLSDTSVGSLTPLSSELWLSSSSSSSLGLILSQTCLPIKCEVKIVEGIIFDEQLSSFPIREINFQVKKIKMHLRQIWIPGGWSFLNDWTVTIGGEAGLVIPKPKLDQV